MKIINATRNCLLADKAVKADSFLKRLVGLLDRDHLDEGEGLILDPSNSIHSFFMRFTFDALFLDKRNKVVASMPCFKPCRVSPVFFSAASTLELPSGTIARTSTRLGDQIRIE
ncbi:MAG: DUF192 domain-containing protein [Deltaproteobacteria bacterium]